MYEAPDLKLGFLQAPSVDVTCSSASGGFQASKITLDMMLTTRILGHKRSEAEELGSLTTDLNRTQGMYQ